MFERTMLANEKLSETMTQLPQDTNNVFKDSYAEVVKYALSRRLSPTVVSEYETKLIPKQILQDKMNELYEVYKLDDEID
jgi:dethiobiotin synthetase